jgi:hypothetical protein
MTCETYLDHALAITYRRPWRRLFRKQRVIRCWFCDLRVSEP